MPHVSQVSDLEQHGLRKFLLNGEIRLLEIRGRMILLDEVGRELGRGADWYRSKCSSEGRSSHRGHSVLEKERGSESSVGGCEGAVQPESGVDKAHYRIGVFAVIVNAITAADDQC